MASTSGSKAQFSMIWLGSSTKSRATEVPLRVSVPAVREHAVQGVAELVEHGADLVDAQQGRACRRWAW